MTEVRIKKETEIGLVHIHFDFRLTSVYRYILYTRVNMSRENILKLVVARKHEG